MDLQKAKIREVNLQRSNIKNINLQIPKIYLNSMKFIKNY